MYGFSLKATKRYYLTRPWEIFPEIWRMIRYAWQRVYRGWDDSVTWSIKHHLCVFMPQWLDQMRRESQGYPVHLASESDSGFSEEAEKEWDKILNEMAQGFRAGYELNDLMPAQDELYEEFNKRYPKESYFIMKPSENEGFYALEVNDKLKVLEEELNTKEKTEQQTKETMVKFERGLDLFREHFFDLWD